MARSWPAVLLSPVLALADQSVAYALVPWSCSHQMPGVLHLVHAAFLVAILATLVASWRRLDPAFPPTSPQDEIERRNLFSLVGAMTAAFSALVVAAMWIPHAFVPPCVAG